MAVSKGKLLLVTRDVDGGIGRHFVDLAAGMADRGWKVHCVRAAGVEGHVTDHSARLDALAGVTVHEIPLARSIGLGDLRSYLAFRRIVKQHGPFDIAHGHGAKGGVLARLPCRSIKASVYTPHGFVTVDPNIDGLRKTIYEAIEGFFGRFLTDALVTVSTQEFNEALRLGALETACHRIPNGMVRPALLPRDQVRSELGLKPEDQVALFVGRFCHQKAPERFLRLVATLAPQHPELRGVLIGGGDSKPKLIELATVENISDRVVFFDTPKASAYMQAADLLVVPSRYEGFAYSMIEGLAAGLPMVTYDIGGADDLVVEGQTGYIVPQDEEAALFDRAGAIIGTPELQSGMAKAAREHFQRFELATMINRIASVYDSLQTPLAHTLRSLAKGA